MMSVLYLSVSSVTHLATDACLTSDCRGCEFDPGPVPYFSEDEITDMHR